MNVICHACGADAIHNRRLVMDSSTTRTSGSTDFQGSSHRSGSMGFTHYSGTQSVNLRSQTDLAMHLHNSRVQDIQAIIEYLVEPILIARGVLVAEVKFEGREYKVQNPTKSLGGIVRDTTSKLRSSISNMRRSKAGLGANIVGALKGVTSAALGKASNLAQFANELQRVRQDVQAQVQILDQRRCVCLRCGAIQ
jgi:hypothetical protein